MTLAELTSRRAVLQAIEEFNAIGREPFLVKYGFAKAVSYFLQHEGNWYDSKAIVGAAHGFQTGTPLHSSEFSGGEATVSAALSRLGFLVAFGGEWRIPVGAVRLRSQIHGEYGGSTQGGIEPSATTSNVIIYTDPNVGNQHGYDFDGWVGDGETVFDYTGEGQVGDHKLTSRGNAAILNQVSAGRTIRLFETLDTRKRPGGKRQQYLGAFRIDAQEPYRWEESIDRQGQMRSVVVFRLIRKDRPPVRSDPFGPRDEAGAGKTGPSPIESLGALLGPPELTIRIVQPETNSNIQYEVRPRAGERAQRREAVLVGAFENWLSSLGHDVRRLRIRVPGEVNELVTDTYDLTTQILYEAKSGYDRATIRLGIGQLLDYLRFAPDATGALLLPAEPTPDLKALIAACGLKLTFPSGDSWTTQ